MTLEFRDLALGVNQNRNLPIVLDKQVPSTMPQRLSHHYFKTYQICIRSIKISSIGPSWFFLFLLFWFIFGISFFLFVIVHNKTVKAICILPFFLFFIIIVTRCSMNEAKLRNSVTKNALTIKNKKKPNQWSRYQMNYFSYKNKQRFSELYLNYISQRLIFYSI